MKKLISQTLTFSLGLWPSSSSRQPMPTSLHRGWLQLHHMPLLSSTRPHHSSSLHFLSGRFILSLQSIWSSDNAAQIVIPLPNLVWRVIFTRTIIHIRPISSKQVRNSNEEKLSCPAFSEAHKHPSGHVGTYLLLAFIILCRTRSSPYLLCLVKDPNSTEAAFTRQALGS